MILAWQWAKVSSLDWAQSQLSAVGLYESFHLDKLSLLFGIYRDAVELIVKPTNSAVLAITQKILIVAIVWPLVAAFSKFRVRNGLLSKVAIISRSNRQQQYPAKTCKKSFFVKQMSREQVVPLDDLETSSREIGQEDFAASIVVETHQPVGTSNLCVAPFLHPSWDNSSWYQFN